MSELLDKQLNAQKEKTSGVHASSRKPTKKVCNENERNKQTRLFMEGSLLLRSYQKPVKTISMSFGENIMDTMKVFVW